MREWLKALPRSDRKSVGADIKTVQFRWPIGLPWIRPLGQGLREVRSRLGNRISRVVFVIERGETVLLHGFIKKTPAIPQADLALARRRAARLREKS